MPARNALRAVALLGMFGALGYAAASAATPPSSLRGGSDALCRGYERMHGTVQDFAAVRRGARSIAPIWREMSAGELQSIDKQPDFFDATTAHVKTIGSTVALVEMGHFDVTGDGSLATTYCFNAAGSVVRTVAQLGSATFDMFIRRTRYYDALGRVAGDIETRRDLQKPARKLLPDVPLGVDSYRRIGSLPFISLVRTAGLSGAKGQSLPTAALTTLGAVDAFATAVDRLDANVAPANVYGTFESDKWREYKTEATMRKALAAYMAGPSAGSDGLVARIWKNGGAIVATFDSAVQTSTSLHRRYYYSTSGRLVRAIATTQTFSAPGSKTTWVISYDPGGAVLSQTTTSDTTNRSGVPAVTNHVTSAISDEIPLFMRIDQLPFRL